ncbi:hypothetical protein [Glutamicibacter sp. NPDC087583]
MTETLTAAEWVAQTRAAQGLPPQIQDPRTVAHALRAAAAHAPVPLRPAA